MKRRDKRNAEKWINQTLKWRSQFEYWDASPRFEGSIEKATNRTKQRRRFARSMQYPPAGARRIKEEILSVVWKWGWIRLLLLMNTNRSVDYYVSRFSNIKRPPPSSSVGWRLERMATERRSRMLGGERAKWFTSIPRSALVVNISFWPREGNGISELWCVRDTCGAWFLRVLLSSSCGKVNIESSNDKFWRDIRW